MNLNNIIHDNVNSPTNSNILSQADTNSVLSMNQNIRRRDNNRNQPRVRFPNASNQRRNIVKWVDPECTEVHDRFLEFLVTFEDVDNVDDEKYYETEVRRMMEAESTTICVDWQHMRSRVGVESSFNALADKIEVDYYRFEPFINRAVRDFVRTLNPNYVVSEQRIAQEEKDFYVSFQNFDVFLKLIIICFRFCSYLIQIFCLLQIPRVENIQNWNSLLFQWNSDPYHTSTA